MEKITQFFRKNPRFAGLIISTAGAVMLLGAVFDSNLIFGDGGHKAFNPKKMTGIISFFGRTPARVVVGVMGAFAVVFGIFWLIAYPAVSP